MESSFNPDSAAAWQLRIFRHSYPGQVQLRNLRRFLSPVEGKTCLDVGGEPGAIPLHLRRLGGAWVSVTKGDAEATSLQTMLGEDQVFIIQGSELPFEDSSFDTIVIIRYLERIREDALFLRECHRCLKSKGELVILVPQVKSYSLAGNLRSLLKISDAKMGRVRPGYSLRDLYEITKDGFDIVESHSFGGGLVEFLQTFVLSAQGGPAKLDGGELPDHGHLRQYAAILRLQQILKPFFFVAAGLDRLFRFSCNHHRVILARPRPWQQRKSVKLRDGRSIAEAAIQTKIGTAADLIKPLPGT